MKRRIIALTLAAVMAFSLAACGSGNGNDAAGTTESAGETGSESESAPEETAEGGRDNRSSGYGRYGYEYRYDY